MPHPQAALATLRPELAGSLELFDLEMDRQGFIGHRVLPVFDVAVAAGVFGKIPLAQLLQTRDTVRAPGSGYARGKFTFTTDSFATQEHGAEEPVDDRESVMYASYLDAEMVATQRARDAVLRNAEIRIAAAVFNATTFTPTAVVDEWDDAANATPITDVEASVRRVYAASGMWPDSLIINRKVFRNLRLVEQIIDMCKFQGFQDVRPGNVTTAHLSAVFDLPNIIVSGSSKNTANEGQTPVLAQVWSDEYAMVAKLIRTQDIREPGLGRTFHWGADGSQVNGTVESYRSEEIRGEVIRVRHEVQEKILFTAAADLMSNITT